MNILTMILPGQTVDEVFNRFLLEREIASSTERNYRIAYSHLQGLAPVQYIKRVDRGVANKLRDGLQNHPSLSKGTANLILTNIKTFCGWAVSNDYLSTNPFTGKRVTGVVAGRKQRNIFSSEDLKLLFDHLPDQGKWIPYIALFSGLRLGEILHLHAGDIQKDSGGYHFDIHEKNYKLKNQFSIRKVPVHSKLIEMGLFEFINGKSGLLFVAEQSYSVTFSRYKKDMGFDSDQTFHSLRHTLIQTLKDNGVPTDIIERIVGHSHGTMIDRYGTVAKPEPLRDYINQVEYELCG